MMRKNKTQNIMTTTNYLTPTTQSPDGTSFHMHTVNASVNQLIDVFGFPRYADNDGWDKVNFVIQDIEEWVLEDPEGNIVTIYDWKNYRSISKDEIINWHIGGKSGLTTLKAAEAIKNMLK